MSAWSRCSRLINVSFGLDVAAGTGECQIKENSDDEQSCSKYVCSDLNPSSSAGDSGHCFVSDPANRTDLSPAGPGSFLAHDQ